MMSNRLRTDVCRNILPTGTRETERQGTVPKSNTRRSRAEAVFRRNQARVLAGETFRSRKPST